MNLISPKIFIVLFVLVLQACGSTNIRPEITSEHLSQYTSAYISNVDVQSKEQNGDSLEANQRMKDYAGQQLEALIEKNQYTLVTPSADTASLEFSLSIDIIYGSRAARYWGGFGAGKGSVNSTFEVKDSINGEIKYSASGKSSLSMGAFGGSMEVVIKDNIDKLINAYNSGK